MVLNTGIKFSFYTIIILGITFISACSSSRDTRPVTGIGSIGPGGGIVFVTFDDNNTTGLEVFPSAIGESSWGCEGIVVDEGINQRASNGLNVPSGAETSEVLRAANTAGICFAGAAQLTFEFVNNDFNDWYLPSTDELIMIRELGFLPGTSGDAYWSSTENTGQNAFVVIIRVPSNPFDNGDPSTSNKSNNAEVVTIRRFQL